MAKDAKKPNKHLPRLSYFETVFPNRKGWISPAFQALTDKILYLTNA